MDPNPFAVLSLMVAPAILTNASSVLITSTSTRLARSVDRARELAKQLEQTTDFACEEPRRRLKELSATEQRALLLLRALRCFYVALGAFASAALASLLGAVVAPLALPHLVLPLEAVGVVTGVVAVGALISGSAILLHETRIAVQIVSERVATVRERVEANLPISPASDKHL